MGWQPYHVLVKDLEPWLVIPDSEKGLNYDQMMHAGKKFFNNQRWMEARGFFEDASVLRPGLHEPNLFLARIKLAQNELKTSLIQLSNLQSRFPKILKSFFILVTLMKN